MTSVTLPEDIIVIGWWAFEDCISLTDVYYAGNEKQWECMNSLIDYEGYVYLEDATIHCNSAGPTL